MKKLIESIKDCLSYLKAPKASQASQASQSIPVVIQQKYNVVPGPVQVPDPVSVSVPVADTDATYLYVILPYFNYCFFQRRKQLFQEFVQRISKQQQIRVVIAEGIEQGEQSQLKPEDLPNTLLHLKIETQHRIWLKENLINIAVKYLPKQWSAIAWIDADLTFHNEDWVKDTLTALQTDDVVQLFESCEFLGPDGSVLKTDRGFGYMYRTSGKPYTKTHKYGFWHPGFAWACSRRAYETMKGLIDWGILGSGDHHMALALIGKVGISHPAKLHPAYVRRLKEFEERIKGLKLGYVKGRLSHHWHGRLEDRKYQERWTILTKYQYNPDKDLYVTKQGVLQLTLEGLRLREDIHDYFQGRQEDRKIL